MGPAKTYFIHWKAFSSFSNVIDLSWLINQTNKALRQLTAAGTEPYWAVGGIEIKKIGSPRKLGCNPGNELFTEKSKTIFLELPMLKGIVFKDPNLIWREKVYDKSCLTSEWLLEK